MIDAMRGRYDNMSIGRLTGRLCLMVLVSNLLIAGFLFMSGPASAQTDPYTDDEVGGVQIRRVEPVPPSVPDDSDEVLGTRIGNLPVTGADLTLYVAAGVAAIGGGTLLVVRSRRKRGDAEA